MGVASLEAMTKCAKGVGLFGLAIALLAGCGGNAVQNGQATGATGNVGGATNNVGGATNHVGGAAGTMSNDLCALPQVSGPCDAYAPSFWHNPKTGVCEPFVYGGCDGNANRFATRAACLAACPGSGADWGACQYDSDCALTTLGCCGACEPLADNQFAAVNSTHLADLRQQSCMGGATCGACPSTTEYDATGKYFKPVCVSGECTAIDIRTTPALTACTSDGDCALRDGADCCPECDGSGFVAVNNRANLCDGAPTVCGQCVSLPPSGLKAACTSGACALALPTR
jgi:trypsin inhibitor